MTSSRDMMSAQRHGDWTLRRRPPATAVGGPLAAKDPATATLIADLRQRLGLDGSLADDAILTSLEDMARFTDPAALWAAACDSTLGHWLALHGIVIEAALPLLVSAVPVPLDELGAAART